MNEAGLERLLLAIAQGRAEPAERAALEFHLLDILGSDGAEGLLRALEAIPSLAFELSSTSGDGEFRITGRGDGHHLVVSGQAGADLTTVDVSVPTDVTDMAVPDPGHTWFYQRWESLLGIDDETASTLAGADQAVFLIGLLEAEVMNGGLGQYMVNTDGIWAELTLGCLAEIGAVDSRNLLALAIDLGARESSLVESWDRHSEEFRELDDRFMQTGDDLAGLAAIHFMSSSGAA